MPKPTNKDRANAIKWLTTQLSQLQRVFSAYVDYKKDTGDFQKHLIDLNEQAREKAKNDTNTTSEVDS